MHPIRVQHARSSDSSIPVDVLLVSRDQATVRSLSYFMQQAHMRVEPCDNAALVVDKLKTSRFDGIACDLQDRQQGLELLTKVRRLNSCKRSIALAIIDNKCSKDDVRATYEAGADLVLERPFSPRIASPTLRVAYSLMLREKRKYFRSRLCTTVKLSDSSGSSHFAKSLNISQEGMAILATERFRVGEQVRISVSLPNTEAELQLNGKVSWVDGRDKLGIQFLVTNSRSRELLDLWLSRQLDKSASCHA